MTEVERLAEFLVELAEEIAWLRDEIEICGPCGGSGLDLQELINEFKTAEDAYGRVVEGKPLVIIKRDSEVIDRRMQPEGCEDDCGQCQNCLEAEAEAYFYKKEVKALDHTLYTQRILSGYYDRTPEPYEPEVLDGDIPF